MENKSIVSDYYLDDLIIGWQEINDEVLSKLFDKHVYQVYCKCKTYAAMYDEYHKGFVIMNENTLFSFAKLLESDYTSEEYEDEMISTEFTHVKCLDTTLDIIDSSKLKDTINNIYRGMENELKEFIETSLLRLHDPGL